MKKKTTAAQSRPKGAKAPAAVASARKALRTASSPAALLSEVRELILQTRQTVAQGVNSALVLLYWQIGQRIRIDILKEKRAGYGERIFHVLSGKLMEEFGRGFSERNLANMVRCAEVFPDANILHALRAKLSWSHFRRLIHIEDPLNRESYGEVCRLEQWSVRTLPERIQSMLFERTAQRRAERQEQLSENFPISPKR